MNEEEQGKKIVWASIMGVLVCLVFIGVFIFSRYMYGKEQEKGMQLNTEENVSKFDSPYTYIEKRKDGFYDAYIYSFPVQWRDGNVYRKIDNGIKESKKEYFRFENKSNCTKTYFPKKICEPFHLQFAEQQFQFKVSNEEIEGKLEHYNNFYNEKKEAVSYRLAKNVSIYAYPINSGFHLEYVYYDGLEGQELPQMFFGKEDASVQNRVDEYVVLGIEGEKRLLISAPLVYEKNQNKLIYDAKWKTEKDTKTIHLEMENVPLVADGEVRIEYRIQFLEEAAPDTTVYEYKDYNSYLAGKAIIGTSPIFGQAMTFMRYRMNYFWEINPESIIKAEFVTKLLGESQDSGKLKMYQPSDQWSSTQMLWKDKIGYDETICQSEARIEENNKIIFDVTKLVQEGFGDSTWMLESFGSVVVCDSGYKILASSDHGEYIPYLKITLKELPLGYIERESINEVEN